MLNPRFVSRGDRGDRRICSKIVAAIILWNTVDLGRTVAELRSQGEVIAN